jgi:hypothetical protein
MKYYSLYIIAICLLFSACSKTETKRFNVIDPKDSGLHFKNDLDESPQLNILTYLYYYNGAGVAAADFNNDNLIDLYFTSNQQADKLFLNKGNLKFEDITDQANIQDFQSWSTGVTYVDINQDGLLDIYVCKASGYRSLAGQNVLYVNQGINNDGVPTFKEEAATYGIDFSGLSTQAAFFDFDLDGDLDLYLMNHSVHPNRAYGKGSQRLKFSSRSGDRLYRNDENVFVDISQDAGIFQGEIGYGLGLAISDIDQNGYPDIYVGNDFFENDYLYLNQGNNTFKDLISENPEKLGHTTHFSMGNDIADINNDGLTDIVAVDMLPTNLKTYKASGLEFPYPSYANYLKNGYSPQYMQNALHLNLGNLNFSEYAHMAGVSATDWSWGALLADYDNDGLRDLFITNGIKGATNDMDFIRFISNEAIQHGIDKGMTEEDMALIKKIPEIKVPNQFFKNQGDNQFKKVTTAWSSNQVSFSNGCIYADLDNDGDLDIVVNNVNDFVQLLENTTDSINHYLKIAFKGNKANQLGIGASVKVFTSTATYFAENFNTRGYLSSVPPILHFGLGENTAIDSLIVNWPSGERQILKNIETNQQLTLAFKDAIKPIFKQAATPAAFTIVDSIIDFKHKERSSLEFYHNSLIPYASTNEGPEITIGDCNNDGKADLFISGAKLQASKLYLQAENGSFLESQSETFEVDAKSEDISQLFFDANGDDWLDLIVVSGGNEFKSGIALQPRLYINNKGVYTKDNTQFQNFAINASQVRASDIDNDGDIDITIASDLVPLAFGETSKQFIFENNGLGAFNNITSSFAPEFEKIGNVKDLIWYDLDNNGYLDLIVAGHWMPISIFLNNGKQLILQTNNGLDKTHGLWNTIKAVDIDLDGDLDFVAGNFGLNSKLTATAKQPLKLYLYDFDSNGSTETLVSYFYEGQETPLASKDELVQQMPYLNKEYLSYASFATATMNDLFGKKNLEKSVKKYCYSLATTVFENDGKGNYKAIPLPGISQVSTTQDIAIDQLNKDSYPDLILVGNNYEINTQLGRMDASHGLTLLNNKAKGFNVSPGLGLNISGPARSIQQIKIDNQDFYIIGINNNTPLFLKTLASKNYNEYND